MDESLNHMLDAMNKYDIDKNEVGGKIDDSRIHELDNILNDSSDKEK